MIRDIKILLVLLFIVGVCGSVEAILIPEPATKLLFGIGILGLAGVSRRKNNF